MNGIGIGTLREAVLASADTGEGSSASGLWLTEISGLEALGEGDYCAV